MRHTAKVYARAEEHSPHPPPTGWRVPFTARVDERTCCAPRVSIKEMTRALQNAGVPFRGLEKRDLLAEFATPLFIRKGGDIHVGLQTLDGPFSTFPDATSTLGGISVDFRISQVLDFLRE